MKISRDWATPVTIGVFCLMAITGILMFFHLDSGLNKTAHEWLGWLMVAGVATHAFANLVGFKRHFASNKTGRAILVISAFVIAGSFVPVPSSGRGMSPPILAMKAVTSAPLTTVAQLAGKPVARIVSDLAQVGIRVSSPDSSLESIVAGNRELQAKALNSIFSVR